MTREAIIGRLARINAEIAALEASLLRDTNADDLRRTVERIADLYQAKLEDEDKLKGVLESAAENTSA